MDDKYLKEALDNYSFTQLYKLEHRKDSRVYYLTCFGSKHSVKFRAEFEDESVEITKDSKNFRYLVSLQSFTLRRSLITLKNSLELELFFAKVFPRAFSVKINLNL